MRQYNCKLKVKGVHWQARHCPTRWHHIVGCDARLAHPRTWSACLYVYMPNREMHEANDLYESPMTFVLEGFDPLRRQTRNDMLNASVCSNVNLVLLTNDRLHNKHRAWIRFSFQIKLELSSVTTSFHLEYMSGNSSAHTQTLLLIDIFVLWSDGAECDLPTQ